MALRWWLKIQLLLAKCGLYVVVNGKTSWPFERLYEQRYGRFWSIVWDGQHTPADDAPLYGGRR